MDGAMNALRRLHIPDILLLLAIAVLACLSLFVVDRWHAALVYPFQIDVSEGFILQQATALARGQTIYGPIDTPPYLVGNYPPLLPLVYAALNGPRATLSSLIIGRWLIVATTLLCLFCIAAIVHRLTRRWTLALLAPLIFLINYEVSLWSLVVRVDFPALFLTLAGLLFFVSSPRRWNLATSGLLFTAAAYTRQTAILAPAACAIALALHDRRRLAWFIAPAALVGLAALALLQWLTGGEFLRHTVTYNANRMEWPMWLLLMKHEIWFFYRFYILALIAALAGGFLIRSPAATTPHETTVRATLGLYALLGAASLLSYAKVGAGVNYVLEPLAATLIWLAVSLGRLFDAATPRSCPKLAWTIAVAALLLAHSGRLVLRRGELFSSATPIPYDKICAGEMAQYLRGVKGELLCEEPFFTLLAGQPVRFDPFIMSQLAKEGTWDQAPFLRMIERQDFARIVTDEDLMPPQPAYERYTTEMAAAMRRRYRPVATVFRQAVVPGVKPHPGVVILPGVRLRYFIYEPVPANP